VDSIPNRGFPLDESRAGRGPIHDTICWYCLRFSLPRSLILRGIAAKEAVASCPGRSPAATTRREARCCRDRHTDRRNRGVVRTVMWGTFDLRKSRNCSSTERQHRSDSGRTGCLTAFGLMARGNAASVAAAFAAPARHENAQDRPVPAAGKGRGPAPLCQ
jgi:hypothetical protein